MLKYQCASHYNACKCSAARRRRLYNTCKHSAGSQGRLYNGCNGPAACRGSLYNSCKDLPDGRRAFYNKLLNPWSVNLACNIRYSLPVLKILTVSCRPGSLGAAKAQSLPAELLPSRSSGISYGRTTNYQTPTRAFQAQDLQDCGSCSSWGNPDSDVLHLWPEYRRR